MATQRAFLHWHRGEPSLRSKLPRRFLLWTFATFCAVICSLCLAVRACGQLFPATRFLGKNSQCDELCVAGDRVAFIVEASTEPWHLADSHSERANVRGYLFTARLAGDGQSLVDRHVIGPLYQLNGPLPSMANQGVPFSQDDRRQLNTKGSYRFGVNGELTKSVYSREGRTHYVQQWALRVEDKKARWVKGPLHVAIPLLGVFFDPHYFESVTGRYAVQEESEGALRARAAGQYWFTKTGALQPGGAVDKEFEGPIRVYDKLLNKRVDDPWLQAVLLDYLSDADLRNSGEILPDDFRYLVIVPRGDRYVKEFTRDGKSYTREKHILVYTRPDKRPAIYDAPPLVTGHYVEIERKPLILDQSWDDGGRSVTADEHEFRLRDLEGHVVLTHVYTDDEKWLTTFVGLRIRDNPDRKCTVFYYTGDSNNVPIHVAIWNYRSPRMSVYETNAGDLFELKGDGYYPKDVIPIEDGR
jgi:hypothetical protein